MKRSFLILLALTLAFTLTVGSLTALAEGGSAETTQPTTETTQPTAAPTTPTAAPTTPTEAPTTPTEAPTTPTEAPTTPTEAPTTPTERPTEAPTTPSTAPAPGIPVVTKSPTGETVREGGFAEFVARADYCQDIIWHLRSPGGGTDVLVKDAGSQFPGLVVTGLNTERLGLNNIPMALNEWRVLAEFVGTEGNVWSNSAIITVMNQELTAPTISQQPISANLKATEGTTLHIGAVTSERNTSLTYQWYKNTINSNVGGKAILGATGASFTPDYVPGTTYYYCAVRCTKGGEFSPTTKSTCAAVTYVTTPEAATVPTVTQVATAAPTDATLTPWNEITAPSETETLPAQIPNAPARSNTLLLIVVGVIIFIAVLGIIATVLILKFYPRDEDDDPRPPRHTPPRAPQSPAPRRQTPPQSAHTPRFAAKPTEPAPQEEEWDDLSDLGDLSIYLDDQDGDDQ